MGIQTTRYITRKDAEEKAVDAILEQERRSAEIYVKDYYDEKLEDIIDEEFFNYIIKEDNDRN